MRFTPTDLSDKGAATLLDRFLRFDKQVALRYEQEFGHERVCSLRRNGLIGILFYNAYNFTSVFLLSDILWFSIIIRVLLVTPATLSVVWLLAHIDSRSRERLTLFAMIAAGLPPMIFFLVTGHPFGSYTFSELVLLIVYGNMLIVLRFRHAVIFTALTFTFASFALIAKSELDGALRLALAMQFGTACGISLFANYQTEARRCRDYLKTLGAIVSFEEANAERLKYRDLSRIDPLTEMPNRRRLNEFLDHCWAINRSIAVIMIDIDYFKLFNDALGHQAGDDCLRSLGAMFATFSPVPDMIFARFGGEEFILVMMDINLMEAAHAAAKLLHAVQELSISHPGRLDALNCVTISIGVAFKAAGLISSSEHVLALADRALYQAKHRGRNCFVIDNEYEIGQPVGLKYK